ncbi:hypothetical protein BIW11_03147 [Tropilaelaps mercedesae]|uniref:Uncharacterized protein n=1 Tax=Tropilaelaps mercedesae TaxID=418985 RepID=A0A1V9XRW7_9ACAR|nr:hypothetical protein BIW11_03147 [Tropilaelaps mercedesae]
MYILLADVAIEFMPRRCCEGDRCLQRDEVYSYRHTQEERVEAQLICICVISAANVHLGGDGAVFKYKNACGKVEQGLKEMLERIYGHLDKLYDEMMARSLKRRATFLSECIQAEIVRQADLMLQLSRLDEVLQRKLERIRVERAHEVSSGGEAVPAKREGDKVYKEEDIEDCDEEQEQRRVHAEDRTTATERSKKPTVASHQDVKTPVEKKSSPKKADRVPEPESVTKSEQKSEDTDAGDQKTSYDKKPMMEKIELSEDETSRTSRPRQETSRASTKVGASLTKAGAVGEKTSVAGAEASAPAVSGPPIQPVMFPLAGQNLSGQTSYPLYVNPSCLTYSLGNPNNMMYLAGNGSGTFDASQLSAALQGQPPSTYTPVMASPVSPGTFAYANVQNVTGGSDGANTMYIPVAASSLATPGATTAEYQTAEATTAHQQKSQLFSVNGVPVNGVLFNVQDQVVPSVGHVTSQTGSGDSGGLEHCLPLANTGLSRDRALRRHRHQ